MPQAIITRYLPQTATKPARIKAMGSGAGPGGYPSLTVPYHTDNCEGGYWAHKRVAEAFARKLKWSGQYRAQEMRDCWIFVHDTTISFTVSRDV